MKRKWRVYIWEGEVKTATEIWVIDNRYGTSVQRGVIIPFHSNIIIRIFPWIWRDFFIILFGGHYTVWWGWLDIAIFSKNTIDIPIYEQSNTIFPFCNFLLKFVVNELYTKLHRALFEIFLYLLDNTKIHLKVNCSRSISIYV